MQEKTAIILAGGASKRLGKDKRYINFNGKPLLGYIVDRLKEYFQNILIIGDLKDDFGVSLYSDIIETGVKNSLTGLYSGLKLSDSFYNYVFACDMPFINFELLKIMEETRIENPEAEVVMPCVDDYYQPLHAIYSKDCLPILENNLKNDNYRITSIYEKLKVAFIPEQIILEVDKNMHSFFNINTEGDYNYELNILKEGTTNNK